MENIKFDWHANIFEAKQPDVSNGSLVISGELVNAEICANNFALDVEELPKIAKQVQSATLRIDHGKSVRDVIGGFRSGTYDETKKRIMFEAEVDDPAIQRSIIKGRLKYISIGASADAFCSKCGKSTKPFRTCKCVKAFDIIKNVKLKEASIITEPAYKSSEFQPIGFMASLNSAIAEMKVTPDSSKEDKAGPYLNKKLEDKRKMSDETKEMKTANAEKDELLAKRVEDLTKIVASLATKMQKAEDEKAAKIAAGKAEAEKKEKEEAKKTEKTEKDEMVSKLESILSKLEELSKAEKEEKKQKVPPEEEEEEEEEEKKKKEKKAEKKEEKNFSGAKVEDASGKTEITADDVPPWFKEVKAFAEKEGILD